jgi:AraC-like DNA-binding protein/quercetin dioxygenase-like cupin family protein
MPRRATTPDRPAAQPSAQSAARRAAASPPSSARPFLPLDPALYAPTPARPVRAKVRTLDADAHVVPHSHPWAQVVFSTTGVCRVTAEQHSYIVPPSRAVWVPAGVEHAVTVVERAELRTLYLRERQPGDGPPALEGAAPGDWSRCRVLEVSALLREGVLQLAATPGTAPATAREQHLAALVSDELARARPVALGVVLPTDKRLRTLCDAVIDDPLRHASLDGWAADAGASTRTVARLFRQELDTSFGQWRQQVLLAKALSMAAQRRPMNHIASALGYASASAFSAMVRRSVGLPPTQLLAGAAVHPPVASPSPAANRAR